MPTFPKIKKAHYLSSILYSNAKILSNKCKDLEINEATAKSNDLLREHSAYFFGSIFNCVTMLESYINEFFFDISEKPNNSTRLKKIPVEKLTLIKKLWDMEIPKTSSYSILEKYQIALTLLNKEKFDIGIEVYQDADILIKLRNSLIHYEPEWIEISNPEGDLKKHRLEKLLRNKFSLYSRYSNGLAFFPIQIVGFGCSEWAIKTVENFLESFDSKLNMD